MESFLSSPEKNGVLEKVDLGRFDLGGVVKKHKAQICETKQF